MTRRLMRLLPLLAVAALAACENQVPTAVDEELLPVGPVTVEVRLPWSQFGSGLRVLGGYGAANEVGLGFLANKYQGTLDARTLFHLDAFPTEASVRDSTGTTRTDTNLRFVGGSLMLRFDTEASTNTGTVTVVAAQTRTHFDARTATWENAVDSVDRKVPWPEPGGGPADSLSQIVWDRAAADSVMMPLDSAAVATLTDSTSERGIRLSMVAASGERVEVKAISLYLTTRASSRPDSLISLNVTPVNVTFIYTPPPPAPTDGLRVGGIPSWRSVFNVRLPATVPGTPAACARVTCPLQLTPERITYAGLVLTTRPVEAAYRPTDSLAMEARSVLAPEVLPKSPLGGPLFLEDIGRTIGASLPVAGFQPGTPRPVELAITPLVQDLVRGKTLADGPVSPAIALLSLHCPSDIAACFESRSLTYASFVGPGAAGEPVLRLLVTVSGKLELP